MNRDQSATSFADLLTKFQGDRSGREMAEFFGCKLGTYRNWVQGRRIPHPMIVEAITNKIKETKP